MKTRISKPETKTFSSAQKVRFLCTENRGKKSNSKHTFFRVLDRNVL